MAATKTRKKTASTKPRKAPPGRRKLGTSPLSPATTPARPKMSYAPLKPLTLAGGNPFDAPAGDVTQQSPPPSNWHPSAIQRMRNLRNKRKLAKASEKDLITQRDGLVKEIAELGSDHTPGRAAKCADHFDTIEALKKCRGDQKWYADQLETTMDEADQGKLWEDDIDPVAPVDAQAKLPFGDRKAEEAAEETPAEEGDDESASTAEANDDAAKTADEE